VPRAGDPRANAAGGRNGFTRKALYLDAYGDSYRLVVEIEGIHHSAASMQISDALR
jgi:hypothetical protein